MQEFKLGQFVAGIAVFVYAMTLLESSLKNLAGRSFKKFLQRQSQSKIKMLAASTAVSGILQSSSVVLLMVLSFVGAGLINMRGALAAVLGSNLGTTLYSWVIAYIGFKINLAVISFPVLGIALIGLLVAKKNTKLYHFTTFLIGFAFVFIALEWLKGTVDKSLENYIGSFSHSHYLLYIPVGIFITAIIQSSSVTIAITLAALYNQVIPFESAAAVVIGSELGTTLKFLFASVGSIPDKKKVAWGNFMLNFITMLIAGIMLKPIVYCIQSILNIQNQLIGLVVFQSGINVISILLFYPLLGKFGNLLDNIFKNPLSDKLTKFIRKTAYELPGDALDLAEKETFYMMIKVCEINQEVLGIKTKNEIGLFKNIKNYISGSSSYQENYSRIKMLQGEILEYITEIPKNDMSYKEMEHSGKLINVIRHILRSAKNVKDIRHNIEEFESTANDDLFKLFTTMQQNTKEYYDQFYVLFNEPDKIISKTIDNLITANRKQYDEAISLMFVALREKKISELDSTNLLNTYREVYSSNKALINAFGDLNELIEEEL